MRNSGNLRKVNPGFNPSVHTSHFLPEELKIIQNLAKHLYVTSGGGQLRLGATSDYRYFLVKPTDQYVNMFNLERELLVLFSPYNTFEPRTLDAIDKATKNYQQLRLERIVTILISKDTAIENKIKRLLATEHETQIIVPFTYEELTADYDEYFLSNRFRDHFYNRDLFAYEMPLKRDLYFFGRTNLVQDIVNRFKTGENSGLFGLRKTGKTSVINAVGRVLDRDALSFVVIDCQEPAFHQRRWNEALHYIATRARDKIAPKADLLPDNRYTKQDASLAFESDLATICRRVKGRLLIIFDEIENITHGIAASEHWKNDYDFIYFWQTIRALCQKQHNLINFLIVGTNPRCIEESRFRDIDNPIFNLVPFQYIPRFEYEQTKEMVGQLGRIMGLVFDDATCARLTEDYGGHPYLIRHACSVIHGNTMKKRPVTIGKVQYEKGKAIFDGQNRRYITMILEVLHKFYSDEYEMLKYLALGETKDFDELANISSAYTDHLIGYGLVEKQDNEYFLKVDAIRDHFASVAKYKAINLSKEQMLAEISERRNRLEPKLRFVIRTQLAARLGEKDAYKLVMDVLDKSGGRLAHLSYLELFDPSKSTIYFPSLTRIIAGNWEYFKHIFKLDKNDFEYKMGVVNRYRKDAHAAKLNDTELTIFRACIGDIETAVKNYIE